MIWEKEEYPSLFNGEIRPVNSCTLNSSYDEFKEANLKKVSIEDNSNRAEGSAQNDDISEMLDLIYQDDRKTENTQDDANNMILLNSEPANLPDTASNTEKLNIGLPLDKKVMGDQVVSWIKKQIMEHKLMINDANALVHIVDSKAFLVSPGIFQLFCEAHPELNNLVPESEEKPWRWVQKGFSKLKLHEKRDDGLNIWTCKVIGPRKSGVIKGYLTDANHFLKLFQRIILF